MLENTMKLHDTQHDANVRELNTKLRGLLFAVEVWRLERLMLTYCEELKAPLGKDGRDSEERKAKLKRSEELIDAQFEVLRKRREEWER